MHLIDQSITVELDAPGGGVKEPVAFTWRGRRHAIAEIVAAWADYGFGAGEVTRTWYRRRHRNYYRVRTEEGALYELYLDRSGSRRQWVLSKELP